MYSIFAVTSGDVITRTRAKERICPTKWGGPVLTGGENPVYPHQTAAELYLRKSVNAVDLVTNLVATAETEYIHGTKAKNILY